VHERELLLVLDNLEHVLDAAPQIHQLVLNSRALKAISSSRAPLRVSGEWEYPIPELADEDAVALFRERAEAIKPDFRLNGDATTVGEICRRLDGLPLAIELAAARAKVLSPIALLERLEQRLPMLSVGARDLPDRQRTLRDTIAWSYELLDEGEQRRFARLALFVGGFTLAAAEQVCDADLDVLTSLVEKSLVRHQDERFRMLETIREFALERLEESGEVEQVARRHIEFFLGFVSDKDSNFRYATPESLERVGSEQDNLRAALQLARRLDDPRLELQLVAVTGRFWELHGYLAEGLRRIVEALDRDPEAPADIRTTALSCAKIRWQSRRSASGTFSLPTPCAISVLLSSGRAGSTGREGISQRGSKPRFEWVGERTSPTVSSVSAPSTSRTAGPSGPRTLSDRSTASWRTPC
jgi:predicted ATPase